jgi:alpha-1,2-mannosyltransferase
MLADPGFPSTVSHRASVASHPRPRSHLLRLRASALAPRPLAGLGLYLVSTALLLSSHLGHGWGFVDLHVYERSGRAVRDGLSLYTLRFPGALAFTYPPFAALALAPATLPANALLEPLVTAASLALLPLLLALALRLELPAAPRLRALARPDRIALALAASAAAVWLEPVWTTLRYGQVDLAIATLVVWDLGRSDGARTKGFGVGLATALKLTPGIFAIYLLLSGRVRAAGVAFATFAGSVALGFALIPADSREFWGGAFAEPNRVGRVENAANQSLRGALARVLHTQSVDGVWLALAALVAVLGMTLAVRAARRGDQALGFSLCALCGLLISPVSWSHHWVLAVPALMLLLLEARRRRSHTRLLAGALIALVAFAHVIWWVPIDHPLHSELHLGPLQLVYADAYVLIGLAVLIVAAASEVRARAGARGPSRERLGAVQPAMR